MQMNFHKILKKDGRGFTLIEVIVSLVIAAILAAILVSFMGTAVMKSANPVLVAQNGAYLTRIMDKMTADYKYQMTTAMKNGSSPADGLNNLISHLNTSNYYSDGAHPYTVTRKRITFSGTPPVENSAEDANSKILKVTVKYRDLTATTIFTE